MPLILLWAQALGSVLIQPGRMSPPIVYVSDAAPVPRYPVQVEIRGGDSVLWSGIVHAGGAGTVMLSHNLSEPGVDCGSAERGREQTNSYTFSLYPRSARQNSANTIVQVNASWTRSEPGDCAQSPGSRTVSLIQSVDLASGRPVVLRGDGGLIITLRRQ